MPNQIGPFGASTQVQGAKVETSGRICGIDVFAILFTLLGLSLGLAALAIVLTEHAALWVEIVSLVALLVILVQLLVFCVREKTGYKVVLALWVLQLGTAIALLVFVIISVVQKDDRVFLLSKVDTVLLIVFHVINIIVALIIGVLYRLAHKYDVYG
uniref:MARVEL domain-containing protein n=1 Tax=Panagrellus redivivus TaxID=6233 RepID=A0A7E4WEA2_PANRE